MHTFVCPGLPKTADDPSGVETIKTERLIEHIKKCNFHIYRMVLTVRPTLNRKDQTDIFCGAKQKEIMRA